MRKIHPLALLAATGALLVTSTSLRTTKSIMRLFVFLFTCALLNAQSIPTAIFAIAWDANPADQQVTGYCVYEINATNAVLLSSVPTNRVILINVPAGKHTYHVTAVNFWGESTPSNTAGTPAMATPPTNNQLSGPPQVAMLTPLPYRTVEVSVSENLGDQWSLLFALDNPDEVKPYLIAFIDRPQSFFRIEAVR